MAVDRRTLHTLPVAREYTAIVDIARDVRGRGGRVNKNTLATLLGGVLAIVAVIGIIILSALGVAVPSALSDLAFLAGAWYFATSTAGAVQRTRGDG